MGVWQEQGIKLIEDGAGMTAAEADEVRRPSPGPTTSTLSHALAEDSGWRAAERCPRGDRQEDFPKINGYYMFPESHSQAFAATAYQTAWLKRYDQPMGFYPMETLKQDARRFGTSSLYPA